MEWPAEFDLGVIPLTILDREAFFCRGLLRVIQRADGEINSGNLISLPGKELRIDSRPAA